MDGPPGHPRTEDIDFIPLHTTMITGRGSPNDCSSAFYLLFPPHALPSCIYLLSAPLCTFPQVSTPHSTPHIVYYNYIMITKRLPFTRFALPSSLLRYLFLPLLLQSTVPQCIHPLGRCLNLLDPRVRVPICWLIRLMTTYFEFWIRSMDGGAFPSSFERSEIQRGRVELLQCRVVIGLGTPPQSQRCVW